MGFMVAVDTLLCFRQLISVSIQFTESMRTRNIIQNLVLNYLAVILLGAELREAPKTQVRTHAKNHDPAANCCIYIFFQNSDTHFSLFVAPRTNILVLLT